MICLNACCEENDNNDFDNILQKNGLQHKYDIKLINTKVVSVLSAVIATVSGICAIVYIAILYDVYHNKNKKIEDDMCILHAITLLSLSFLSASIFDMSRSHLVPHIINKKTGKKAYFCVCNACLKEYKTKKYDSMQYQINEGMENIKKLESLNCEQ
jgi:ABC-type siderophore export system fused ATPase/permease subunit